MGVEPKIGGKPPKWMVKIMKNPIQIHYLGVPLFLETPIHETQPCQNKRVVDNSGLQLVKIGSLLPGRPDTGRRTPSEKSGVSVCPIMVDLPFGSQDEYGI